MLRCWEARPEDRPSTGDLVTSLGSLLGPEAEAEYEVMFQEYMDTLPLIHREEGHNSEVTSEVKNPEVKTPPEASFSGYIQMSEAVSRGHDEAVTSTSPYIQVGQMSQMSPVSPSSEAQPGYSVHTLSPGGYVTLTQMKSTS